MNKIWPLHTSGSRQVGEMRHACRESPHTAENGAGRSVMLSKGRVGARAPKG